MKARKTVRRKNRKIKFSEINYVEKHYMKNGKAVIPIKVEEIRDLYMRHDYKKMELSNSLLKYIDNVAYMVPINTDIVLEIHCPKISEEMQEKIRKNIKNNYGMDIDDNDYDISENNKISISMAILGVILLIINLTTLNLGPVWSEILTVLWWVPIWDTIEIQMFENRETKEERLNNQQLYDSKVEFVFDNGINPELDDIFNK